MVKTTTSFCSDICMHVHAQIHEQTCIDYRCESVYIYTSLHAQNQPGTQHVGVINVERPRDYFILSFLAFCLCSWCWPAVFCGAMGMIYSVQVYVYVYKLFI